MDITTTRFALKWRAFAGGPWRRSDDPRYWPWTGLSYGAAYTPIAETTLAADLEPGDDHAHMTSAAALPTAGGGWVAGPGAGEAWEAIEWTGKSGDVLTGLTREAIGNEQTGHHSAGARFLFWWPLADNTGALQFTEQIDGPLAAVDWNLRLAGLKFPRAAVRNEHLVLVLVQMAEGIGGDWGAETVAYVGWLVDPKATDDGTGERAWDGQAVGSAGILRTVEISGLRIGAHNSALEGDATGSPELACPYKEYESGEFDEGEPDLGPKSAIDDDSETLYMTERHLGADNKGTGWGIDQVHPDVYVGQGAGGKWIQVDVDKDSLDEHTITWFWLLNQAGYGPAYLSWPDNQAINTVPSSGLVILVENETLFRAENPDTGDALIIEPEAVLKIVAAGDVTGVVVPDSEYTIGQFWGALSAAGGGLKLLVKQGAVVSDPGPSEVIWGSVTKVACSAAWSGGSNWSDAVIPALQDGQTIRRRWAGSGLAAAGYSAGWPSCPGYYLDGAEGALYHSIRRRTLGLRLKVTITAAAPGAGAALQITSDLGDTCDGLDAAGTLQIGGEQITYSAKATDNKSVTVTARGANGTTPASHAAGSRVRAVEGGVATDAWPLSKIEIPRPSALPVPADFVLYGSKLDRVRYPGQETDPGQADEWLDDWTAIVTVTGNALAAYSYTLAPSVRYRHVLLRCSAMSTDPYRLALNEIRLLDDPAVLGLGQNLPDGTTAAGAIEAILKLGGLEDAAIIDLGGTPVTQDVTTEPGMTWDVAADYGDFAACLVRCRRDSKIEIGLNPLWVAAPGDPAADHTWTNVELAAIGPEFRRGPAGQIKLRWRDGLNTAKGIEYYPSTPNATGRMIEVGPYICADATAAQARARKLYFLQRRLHSSSDRANGPAWDALAGQIVRRTWPLSDGTLTTDRIYMLQSITQQIDAMGLESCPVLTQVSREDEL